MSRRATGLATQPSVAGSRTVEPRLEAPAPAKLPPNQARPATPKPASNPAARPARPARNEAPRANHLSTAATLGVTAIVSTALVYGWVTQNSSGLTPGHGLGYWLGIVGGLTMLAVLGYPMRKYMRSWRNFGSTAGWFTAHMLLGTIGPAIVLFHAGFQLGAFNSNVALITMLFVAGSGIIGRYLYGQIHRGLHGRRAEISEMTSLAADMRLALGGDLPQGSPVWNELTQLEAMAQKPVKGLFGAIRQSLALSWQANSVRRHVVRDTRRFIDTESKRYGLDGRRRRAWHKAAREHLSAYFAAISSTARLILFERMFSAWHFLHVPLFVVMTLSVIVHIVAVHFY
jgi:hypothetical protein